MKFKFPSLPPYLMDGADYQTAFRAKFGHHLHDLDERKEEERKERKGRGGSFRNSAF